MAKAKAGKESAVVYVGIDDSVEVRRDILEASKSMVRILKGQNNLSTIRAAKNKLIEELRAKVGELNQLVVEARHALPHMEDSSLPKPTVQKVETAKAEQPKPQKAPTPQRKVEAHVDKFERELQDIEDKLRSL